MSFLKVVFSFVTIFISMSHSSGQARCATMRLVMEHINNKKTSGHKEVAGAQKSIQEIDLDSTITIPVVVHIIHDNINGTIGGPSNPNITDEQVISQIQVLNEDFRRKVGTRGYNTDPRGADLKIAFQLARFDPEGNITNGINRIYNSNTLWNFSQRENLMNLSYWPSDKYLNIYVANLSSDIGYAQFPIGSVYSEMDNWSDGDPETDGVVIHFTAFGTLGTATGKFGYGRTCTHEVGHWLGLVHIWGDSFCGDDYVADTPLQETNSEGIGESCLSKYSNCTGTRTLDMSNNYMDYSPDICMNIFTRGQKNRVRNVVYSSPRRLALLTSKGYDTIVVSTKLPMSVLNISIKNEEDKLAILPKENIENGEIILRDILGNQVAWLIGDFKSGQEISIPMSKLSKGLFVLEIKSSTKYFNKKILND